MSDWKYVALALNDWRTLEALTPVPLPVAPIGASCGFLLVYDSLEALRKEHPTSEYLTIAPVPTKKGDHGKKQETS